MESKCPNETEHVQDDVNQHILRMHKDVFCMAQSIIFCLCISKMYKAINLCVVEHEKL